jgi:hypothetical protein
MNIPHSGEGIPLAIVVDPKAVVERQYPDVVGGGAVPDTTSAEVMEAYLRDRYHPEKPFETGLVFEPTGKTLPRIERTPVGVRRYPWLRLDGWAVSPRTAAAASAVGMAVLNTAANLPNVWTGFKDGGDEVRQVGHGVYRYFNPVPDVLTPGAVVSITPGQKVTVTIDAAASNKAGKDNVDSNAVQKFANGVDAQVRGGGKVVEVRITGRSSDEYSSDEHIGVPEATDNDLSDRRAKAYEDPVITALGTNAVRPKLSANQDVISQQLKDQLIADARRHGFSSLTDAIRKVERGYQTDPTFQKAINAAFTSKRGVKLEADIEMPGQDVVEVIPDDHYEPGVDNPPENPDRDYDPKFVPFLVPPLPRFKKIMKEAIKHAWKFVPGKEILQPIIIKNPRDMAWVRLRPEALKEDGSLVDMPWAYSRKYEHLMRDGRIADILRARFKNAADEEKEIRIMFVDKSPADETVEAFEGLLKQFAAMRGGELADKITGIFVFPESNAGTHPRNPKRIGVGVDKQDESTMLGFCAPALELVEMHMKETLNPDELSEYFADYMGALWTLSHEVAGHGTDIRAGKVRLHSVRSEYYDNAYISSDPWVDRMTPNYKANMRLLDRTPASWFRRMFRGRKNDDKLLFDAEYPVVDRKGQIVTVRDRVTANDPRLIHATRAYVVDRDPTQYGGTNSAELHAEVAASAVTGIDIPYPEAGAQVTTLPTTDGGGAALFAQGYHASHRDLTTYRNIVGADAGSMPVTFPDQPEVDITYTKPENDRAMQAHYRRTRSQRTLRPEEMIAILSHYVGRKRRG